MIRYWNVRSQATASLTPPALNVALKLFYETKKSHPRAYQKALSIYKAARHSTTSTNNIAYNSREQSTRGKRKRHEQHRRRKNVRKMSTPRTTVKNFPPYDSLVPSSVVWGREAWKALNYMKIYFHSTPGRPPSVALPIPPASFTASLLSYTSHFPTGLYIKKPQKSPEIRSSRKRNDMSASDIQRGARNSQLARRWNIVRFLCVFIATIYTRFRLFPCHTFAVSSENLHRE